MVICTPTKKARILAFDDLHLTPKDIAKDIAKDMGQGAASKDLLILAQSTAAVYRQIQTLSEDLNEGLHGRIGGEIDRLKAHFAG